MIVCDSHTQLWDSGILQLIYCPTQHRHKQHRDPPSVLQSLMSASLAAVMSYGKAGAMRLTRLLPYTQTVYTAWKQKRVLVLSTVVITVRSLPSQCKILDFGNSNIYLPCQASVNHRFGGENSFPTFSPSLSRTRRSTARQAVVFSSQRRFSWPKGSRRRINSFEALTQHRWPTWTPETAKISWSIMITS